MIDEKLRSHLILWAGVTLAWVGLLVLFATQYYVALRAAGQTVTWISQVQRELPGWALWAVLSPLVFAAADRFPLVGNRSLRNALIHIPIAGSLFVLYLLLYTSIVMTVPIRPEIIRADVSFADLMRQAISSNFAFFALLYVGLTAVHQVFALQRANQRRALEATQLEASLAQARVDALRQQLQPHFLFNTLHSVSALLARDPRAARRTIANLSDLLRASIDPSDELVSLERELEILSRYLEIQHLRYGTRLQSQVDVPPACRSWRVPSFLLQPLVENAIEHGSVRHAHGGRVQVRATCTSAELVLVVSDDGPGFPEILRTGVGLENTRARLEALYQGEFSMALGRSELGGARVEVVLPRSPRHEVQHA